jgi:hypothetical protein
VPLARAEKRAAHLHALTNALGEDADGNLAKALRRAGTEAVCGFIMVPITDVGGLIVPSPKRS